MIFTYFIKIKGVFGKFFAFMRLTLSWLSCCENMFSSNQPLQHKLGVIRTLHHRCNTICSSEEAKLREIDHLKKVLSVSGYTMSAWVTATKPKAPTVPQDHQVQGQHHTPLRGAPHRRYLQNHPQSRSVRAPQTLQHHPEPPGTPQGQSSQGRTGGCCVPDPVFRLWCRICRWDWEEPP